MSEREVKWHLDDHQSVLYPVSYPVTYLHYLPFLVPSPQPLTQECSSDGL